MDRQHLTRAHCTAGVITALIVGFCLCGNSRAGLYGDEGKDVTTGDLNNQDYWWTRWDMMMLDYAIKQHQPEGRHCGGSGQHEPAAG